MFNSFEGYQEPTVEKINKNCTVATYVPKNSINDIIIGINTYNKNTIYIKNNTLITITNQVIIKLLNTLPKRTKKIKNKRNKKK